MITVKKQEHDDRVRVSTDTFKERAWSALASLERGEDVGVVYRGVIIAMSNLEALKGYKTGEFQPEEYFNVLSPVSETSIYSNINTIK